METLQNNDDTEWTNFAQMIIPMMDDRHKWMKAATVDHTRMQVMENRKVTSGDLLQRALAINAEHQREKCSATMTKVITMMTITHHDDTRCHPDDADIKMKDTTMMA